MTDSKLKSLTESTVNIIPGFGIAYLSNLLILPHYSEGIAASDSMTMLIIGTWYTGISIARSYSFRRLFETIGENENFYTFFRRIVEKKGNGAKLHSKFHQKPHPEYWKDENMQAEKKLDAIVELLSKQKAMPTQDHFITKRQFEEFLITLHSERKGDSF